MGLTAAVIADEPGSMDVRTAATLLEALGNTTRLRIVMELLRVRGAGMSVGALQDKLGIDAKSTLSNHLKQLVQAGLVVQERRSTTLLCRVGDERLAALADFLEKSVSSVDG